MGLCQCLLRGTKGAANHHANPDASDPPPVRIGFDAVWVIRHRKLVCPQIVGGNESGGGCDQRVGYDAINPIQNLKVFDAGNDRLCNRGGQRNGGRRGGGAC